NPKKKIQTAPDLFLPEEEIPGLAALINSFPNPAAITKQQKEGVWGLALRHFNERVIQGETRKRAARKVREYLATAAPFLAPSRNALLKIFNRLLERHEEHGRAGLVDRRKFNGDSFILPECDVLRLRHSAAIKNGRRFDA